MASKLYDELAEWWPIFSAPAHYAEEAALFARILQEAGEQPARTLLELGSGGGNNASFLKAEFDMTLADLSPGMVEVSRALNPECEHTVGDMRSIRLERTFDRVFIHDAIDYLTTLDDVRRAAETAFVHCRPGGGALFVPDHLRETFHEGTEQGGGDGDGRAIRYLEWTWDPDPADNTCLTDYVYMLRERDGSMRVEHDRHVHGLFSRAEWLAALTDAGFTARVVPIEHSEVESGSYVGFVAVRPA